MIGAITSTVATFSTNADNSPVKKRMIVMAMPIEGERSTIRWAIKAGTLEYMKSSASIRLPK